MLATMALPAPVGAILGRLRTGVATMLVGGRGVAHMRTAPAASQRRGLSSSGTDNTTTSVGSIHEPVYPVTFEDVSRASFRIREHVTKTPCNQARKLSKIAGCELFFKQELQQRTGSFKERGACNAMMLAGRTSAGLIAASAGNHALALGYHGGRLGIPVTVVMPEVSWLLAYLSGCFLWLVGRLATWQTAGRSILILIVGSIACAADTAFFCCRHQVAPLTKVRNCIDFGAEVIIHGQHIGESRDFAFELAERRGLTYINGYDHPSVIAGTGTIGMEILEQVPDVDVIVVPVGGAGLIAGLALAVKTLRPDVKIIGAEPERCASYAAAVAAGEPIAIQIGGPTLADGLAVPKVGTNAFNTCQGRIDAMCTVSERSIARAVLRLVEVEHTVVEGAGATGLAAILDGRLGLEGKKVVTVLCGGNIDTPVLGRVIERGLAADGRLVRFLAAVSDRPGGLADLTARIAHAEASVKQITHERAWVESDITKVLVRCEVETRDATHAEEVRQALHDGGIELIWNFQDFDPAERFNREPTRI